MIADPTVLWKATADATWSNNKNTVPGSVGDSSSIAGGFKPEGDAPYGGGNGANTPNSSASSSPAAPRPLSPSAVSAAFIAGLVLLAALV